MKYYFKIITGFREDQFHSVPMQEAHKAYYLFRNPEQRGIFSTGLALVGSSIREIIPDYTATMGWNTGYKVTAEDYAELKTSGVQATMNMLLRKAKDVSEEIVANNPALLKEPLGELIKLLPEETKQIEGISQQLADGFKA